MLCWYPLLTLAYFNVPLACTEWCVCMRAVSMAINLTKPNVCYNISCNSVLQSKIASVLLKSHKVGGGRCCNLRGERKKGTIWWLKSPYAFALVLLFLTGAAVLAPPLVLLLAITVGYREPTHLLVQGRISPVSEEHGTSCSLCMRNCCWDTNSLLICKLC